MESEFSGYGDPRFYKMLEREADLHSRKNHDYARGGDPMGNFNRVANILANYPGLDLSNPIVVAIVYMMKQLDAVLWMTAGKYKGEVEDVATRLQDISVYAKIISLLGRKNHGDLVVTKEEKRDEQEETRT